MLYDITKQLALETDVIAGFAKRLGTRYGQLALIKTRSGHVRATVGELLRRTDISRPP
jgi:hypothetical protein